MIAWQPLPWKPESIESALARLPAALGPIFDLVAMAQSVCGTGDVPASCKRQHVFDLEEENVRVCVTRESLLHLGTMIHFSFGTNPSRPEPQSKAVNCGLRLAKIFIGRTDPWRTMLSAHAYHMHFKELNERPKI